MLADVSKNLEILLDDLSGSYSMICVSIKDRRGEDTERGGGLRRQRLKSECCSHKQKHARSPQNLEGVSFKATEESIGAFILYFWP